MKNLKFLTVALATLMICSCSNENNGILDLGTMANVTIKVVGQETKTRATGNGDEVKEITVKNFVAFAFAGESLSGSAHSENGEPVKLATPTTATKVYVVVNTGSTLTTGLFGSIKSLSDLKAVQGDLANTDKATTTQTGENLWMHGSGKIVFSTDGTTGQVEVPVKFSSAKIQVTVIDNRQTTDVYTYSDHRVSVLQAGAHANFFSTSPSMQTDFYTGDRSYNDPAKGVRLDALTHNVATFDTSNDKFHFYTFGNNINGYDNPEKTPTILTLSSLRKAVAGGDGTGIRKYYPIHFSTHESMTSGTLSSIEPGNKYDITITLKDDGNGTVDPELPVIASSIDVTVKTTPWITVTAGKEF